MTKFRVCGKIKNIIVEAKKVSTARKYARNRGVGRIYQVDIISSKDNKKKC